MIKMRQPFTLLVFIFFVLALLFNVKTSFAEKFFRIKKRAMVCQSPRGVISNKTCPDKLEAGEIVENMNEEYLNGFWVKIKYKNGKTGWTGKEMVEETQNDNKLATESKDLYKVRIDTSAKVDTDILSQVVEEVKADTEVEFLGEKAKGTFDAIYYKIKTPNGNVGWIAEVQLQKK